jgi:hypothetical protein
VFHSLLDWLYQVSTLQLDVHQSISDSCTHFKKSRFLSYLASAYAAHMHGDSDQICVG